MTHRQLEKEGRGQKDLQVWTNEKVEKNGKGDQRCEGMKLEKGTVLQNYGEAMPIGKIRDRKHVTHRIGSGKSQYSLKSPAKGEGNIKNSILKGKTLRLLHFLEQRVPTGGQKADRDKSDGEKCGQPIGVKKMGQTFDPPNKW